MLKEHRDKISDADAKEVESAIEGVRKAMADGGLEQITSATDKLTTASHKLAEAMYKSQPSGNGATGAGAGAGDGAAAGAQAGQKKDNVVDAEFVDVEDKK
jgi:molecular chaperone DnaK